MTSFQSNGDYNGVPSVCANVKPELSNTAQSSGAIESFYLEEVAPRYGQPIGYRESELDQLADAFGYRLPAMLRWYLAFAGHHSPEWNRLRRTLADRRLAGVRQWFAGFQAAPRSGYLESSAYYETPDPGILFSFEQLRAQGRRSRAALLERDTGERDIGHPRQELITLAEWTGGYYRARASVFLPLLGDDPSVYIARKPFEASAWQGLFEYGPLSEFLLNKLRGAGQHPLRGLVIGAAGTSEYTRKAIEAKGGILGSGDVWQHEQIVVVPRRSFDRDYLKSSVAIAHSHDFECRYMSEVDWSLGFEIWGDYPHYFQGDPRIREHDGLQFLSSIGVRWPTRDEPGDLFPG